MCSFYDDACTNISPILATSVSYTYLNLSAPINFFITIIPFFQGYFYNMFNIIFHLSFHQQAHFITNVPIYLRQLSIISNTMQT